MIPYPGFHPIAVELGPLTIHWYGIMWVAGFAAGWWLARQRAGRPGSPWKPKEADDLVIRCMLGAMLGGRIGYVLLYGLTYWAQDVWFPLRVWQGGMSFHGALLGVLIALSVFAWQRGRSVAEVYDFAVPLAPPGLFFVRIGNFINGELWGKPTDLPWGFQVEGVVRHPTQLYEAVLGGLLLFVVLWRFTARPRPPLAVSGLFLLLYGVIHLLIEVVVVPDEHIGYLAGAWLTVGQVLSVPMIVAGILMLSHAYRARPPSGKAAAASPSSS